MSTWEPTGQDTNWESLERQDWHLWILAVLLMFVLGVSLLSFMFPSVFWMGRETHLGAPERAFFGFCVLLALTQKGAAREDAYAMVQRNAMRAWQGEGDFLSLLKADKDVRRRLSEAELEENFDLGHHFKHVDTVFARVFGTAC